MKKKIFLACLIGLLSTTSAYPYTGECNGGTIVESTTGATFCMSNKSMNWWSTQTWCQANGSRLATIYEMCPSWDGGTGYGKCPELTGKCRSYIWSATVDGTYKAFYVQPVDGNIYARTRDEANYAFCR